MTSSGPTTPTRPDCWPRCPSRSRGGPPWSWEPAARRAQRPGPWPAGRLGVGLEPDRDAGGRAGPRSRRNGSGDAGRGQARCDQRRSSPNRLLRADRELLRDRDARTRTRSSTSRWIPIAFGAGVTVVDLVYAGSESRLVAEARARGATAIDGLGGPRAPGCRVASHLDGYGPATRRHARSGSERK